MNNIDVEISEEQFRQFVALRDLGICNMISSDVQILANLSKEEHLYILSHFVELCDKYGID